jgi:hypothetical protein
MKKKFIIVAKFNYMRNEGHYQFLLLVKKYVEAHPEIIPIVGEDIVQKLFELISVEGKLVDAKRSSDYTKTLKTLNKRIDKNIVGIVNLVLAMRRHFDPAFVEAAENLWARLKSFRGQIEKKPYEEESAAVKILVADFKTTYAEQIAILNLDGWVADLEAAQIEFDHIFMLRNTELANRSPERLVDIKKQAEAVYKIIVERINAFNVMNPDDDTCTQFINELNEGISYFNEHNHRTAKIDIANATVESISDKEFEGEPVIVLPAVFYEGEKLTFTKDYTLAYRNNDKPGVAIINISGKGRFKGKLIVTFVIKGSKAEPKAEL